jgi:hypothetical protein
MEEETGIGRVLEKEREIETEKESTILRSRINLLLVATTKGGGDHSEIGITGMTIGMREREIAGIGIGSIGIENSGGEIGIMHVSATGKESASANASCTTDNTASASTLTPTRIQRRTPRVQRGTPPHLLAHHGLPNRMWASAITSPCRIYTTTPPSRPVRLRRGGRTAVIGVLDPRRR